jgi:hypothetical protein
MASEEDLQMACEGEKYGQRWHVKVFPTAAGVLWGGNQGVYFFFFNLLIFFMFIFYVNVKEHHVGSAKAHTLQGYNNDKNPQSLLPIEHSSQKFQHIISLSHYIPTKGLYGFISLSLVTHQQEGYGFMKNKEINFNCLTFFKLLIFIPFIYIYFFLF